MMKLRSLKKAKKARKMKMYNLSVRTPLKLKTISKKFKKSRVLLLLRNKNYMTNL